MYVIEEIKCGGVAQLPREHVLMMGHEVVIKKDGCRTSSPSQIRIDPVYSKCLQKTLPASTPQKMQTVPNATPTPQQPPQLILLPS